MKLQQLTLLFILTFFIALSVDYHANEVKSQKPNMIYILVDDMGFGDVGAFGQKHIKTPSLDQMAAEGMRLTEHYSGSTVCAPSRAALMTGKHTGHVQIRGNFELGTFLDEEEFGQMPLNPGTKTIATMMRDAGYKTALIGKWGLGGPGSVGVPTRQGFDLFFGYLDQKQAHNHYPSHLWLNEESYPLKNKWLDVHQPLPEGVDPNNPESYKPYQREDFAQDHLTNVALDYIKTNKDSPFFLYLSYAGPHAALQVPDEELKQYKHFDETPNDGGYLPVMKPRATRAGMISRIDRDIGKVLQLLQQLGIDENTLVIFSSDNGPSFEGAADLDFFDSNGPLRGYKRDLYEGGIRMPTIAWWPGKIKAGTESDHASANWDIMPTAAELGGAKVPEDIDGISFLPTLLGKNSQKEHPHLYWEFHNNSGSHAQAVRFNEGKNKWKAVRRFTKKHRENPPVELYNLSDDIGETTDLSAKYPELSDKALKLMLDSRTRSFIDNWNFDFWPLPSEIMH